MMRLAGFLLAVLVLSPDVLGASSHLVLRDGRALIDARLEKAETGVRVRLESGSVIVPRRLIRFASVPGYENLEPDLLKSVRTHRRWRDRLVRKTPRFRIESMTPEWIARDYGRHAEGVLVSVSRALEVDRAAGEMKCTVCLFGDALTYFHMGGAPRGTRGYYKWSAPAEIHLYHDATDPARSRGELGLLVAAHVIRRSQPAFEVPDFPRIALATQLGGATSRWAEYLEEISEDLRTKRAPTVKAAIVGKGPHVVEAWRWGLLAYFRDDPRLLTFVDALARGEDVRRVPTARKRQVSTVAQEDVLAPFLRHFAPPPGFETEWRVWLSKRAKESRRPDIAYRIAIDRLDGARAETVVKEALANGTAGKRMYVAAARRRIEALEYAKAAEFLRKAHEADPLDVSVVRELASACARRLDKDEAARLEKLAGEITTLLAK